MTLPEKRGRLGAYFLCNDNKIDWAYAFLASFREYNPAMPLTLIPFNDRVEKMRGLQSQFLFDIMENENFHELESLTIPAFGRTYGNMRRLIAFAGKYDYFFYLDSDIIVTSDLSPLAERAISSKVDFVYFDTDIEQVYKPGAFRNEMVEKYHTKGFNAGSFFSRYGLFELEAIKPLALELGLVKEDLVWTWDQPLLNYFCDKLRVNSRLFLELAPEYFRETWYRHVHPRRMGQYWVERSQEKAQKPICFIHYAGQASPDPWMASCNVYSYYKRQVSGSLKASLWHIKWHLYLVARWIVRKMRHFLKSASASRRGA